MDPPGFGEESSEGESEPSEEQVGLHLQEGSESEATYWGLFFLFENVTPLLESWQLWISRSGVAPGGFNKKVACAVPFFRGVCRPTTPGPVFGHVAERARLVEKRNNPLYKKNVCSKSDEQV